MLFLNTFLSIHPFHMNLEWGNILYFVIAFAFIKGLCDTKLSTGKRCRWDAVYRSAVLYVHVVTWLLYVLDPAVLEPCILHNDVYKSYPRCHVVFEPPAVFLLVLESNTYFNSWNLCSGQYCCRDHQAPGRDLFLESFPSSGELIFPKLVLVQWRRFYMLENCPDWTLKCKL